MNGQQVGSCWIRSLTHFNEFPFRGPLYRKFPARFPRKLSRSRRADDSGTATFCFGNFCRWRDYANVWKTLFPAVIRAKAPERGKHDRGANLSRSNVVSNNKFWFCAVCIHLPKLSPLKVWSFVKIHNGYCIQVVFMYKWISNLYVHMHYFIIEKR